MHSPEPNISSEVDSEKIQFPTDNNENSSSSNHEKVTSTSGKEHEISGTTTNIADVIGEYGIYQLSLTILTFIRYVCVAMMTNSGPLIAPELDFWCKPPDATDSFHNSTDRNFFRKKCDLEAIVNGTPIHYKCNEFIFNTSEYGITLTDTFELACDRDWYRSGFQSTVSIGIMIASIVFGSFSDENGRKFTLRICCVISLVAGSVSIIAPNYTTFAVSRSICSMSDIGTVGSLYTIIVETLGNKFRGTVCIIVFTGWSIGVMVMPWITEHFLNFRHVMLFTVVCHLLTLPWLLTIGESIRWLLINGRFDDAEAEVKRISSWNVGFSSSSERTKQKLKQTEKDFEPVKMKFVSRANRKRTLNGQMQHGILSKIVRSLFGGFLKVGQIFRSRELTLTTMSIIWTSFNSELMYMLFIMINSDVGDDVKLNYAIGGLMEILATLIAIIMISRLTRKLSLTSTLLVISSSIFCLAFTHEIPSWSISVLNFTKLAISTLSSLIYVIATELFPTSLRQTGMGLAATLGSLGAVVAPFIREELTNAIGMTNVMLALFLLPLSAALVIPLLLRETKDVELLDDIDEMVEKEDPKYGGREFNDIKN